MQVARTAFPEYDRDLGLPGYLAPSFPFTFAQQTQLTSTFNNRAYFMRFVPSRTMTIKRIGFVLVASASVDDAVSVGLYDAAGTRLVTSGATTGQLNSTAGPKRIAITDTVLSPNTTYFAGFSVGTVGGTGAFVVTANLSDSGLARMFCTTTTNPSDSKAAVGLLAASHPLPSTFSYASLTNTSVGITLALLEF
jgi:hypothetical protein